MNAKVIWYNNKRGMGTAETEDGKSITLFDRSFGQGQIPNSGDTITISKIKDYPGIGLYAIKAQVLVAGQKQPKKLAA